MQLTIEHQEQYSRADLLLRTFFGWIYIGVPHCFLLFFISLWGSVLSFMSFWAILFTGSYPQNWFNFQVRSLNWSTRVNATFMNLVDGYPAFGLDGATEKVSLTIPYHETSSRGSVLLRLFFGWLYVGIPHGICLAFRCMATVVLVGLAWFAVLFTGRYPCSWHAFNVGTNRWALHVYAYMCMMVDDYPRFSGKEEIANEVAES